MAIIINPKGVYVTLIPFDNPTKNSASRITLDEWVEYKINEVLDKRKD